MRSRRELSPLHHLSDGTRSPTSILLVHSTWKEILVPKVYQNIRLTSAAKFFRFLCIEPSNLFHTRTVTILNVERLTLDGKPYEWDGGLHDWQETLKAAAEMFRLKLCRLVTNGAKGRTLNNLESLEIRCSCENFGRAGIEM